MNDNLIIFSVVSGLAYSAYVNQLNEGNHSIPVFLMFTIGANIASAVVSKMQSKENMHEIRGGDFVMKIPNSEKDRFNSIQRALKP